MQAIPIPGLDALAAHLGIPAAAVAVPAGSPAPVPATAPRGRYHRNGESDAS